MKREKNFKIVFPENDDNRIIEAANFLSKEKLAKIIWLDDCKITSDYITSILKLRPNMKKGIAEILEFSQGLLPLFVVLLILVFFQL